MKKSLILCLLLSLSLTIGCLLDDGKDEEGTGTIKVTVNTSTVIWGYPEFVSGTNYLVYKDAEDEDPTSSILDDQYIFRYPRVGGNGNTSSISTEYYDTTKTGFKVMNNYKNNFVGTDGVSKVGDKKNVVYLFSTIEQKSDNNPVLYKGEIDTNNGTITISDIKAGTYYIVAFYDYASGGNLENILNRYDRYALYADSSDAEVGTANSTPYFDNAATVTIGEDETVEITLDIHENWVMGKPKATYTGGEYEMGRYFLKAGETIPDPF